jgi:hypothetical protein
MGVKLCPHRGGGIVEVSAKVVLLLLLLLLDVEGVVVFVSGDKVQDIEFGIQSCCWVFRVNTSLE